MISEVLLAVNRKEKKKSTTVSTYKIFYLVLVLLFHLIFIYFTKTLKYNKALKVSVWM